MVSGNPVSLMASEVDESIDWEYEYHPTEKETFLVDLDVTSINRPVIASNTTKPRKGLKLGVNKRPTKSTSSGHDTRPKDANVSATAATPFARDNEDDENQDEDQIDTVSNPPDENDEPVSGSLQILDLHTDNPIVSYQGNVYSCSWADMIGTTMVFTEHSDLTPLKPAISTDEYDLIGTTRIKLVGNQAKVVALDQKENTVHTGLQTDSSEIDPRPGASLGDIKKTNPRLNTAIRKQAAFLEKLMDVKKARGESDIVRTVVNKKIASTNGQPSLQNPAKRKKLDQLNRRAIKGDGEAVKKLKKVYSGLDNITSDEGEQSDDHPPLATRPERSNKARPVIESSSQSEDDEASQHEHQIFVSNDANSNSLRHDHNSETEHG